MDEKKKDLCDKINDFNLDNSKLILRFMLKNGIKWSMIRLNDVVMFQKDYSTMTDDQYELVNNFIKNILKL